MVVAVAPGMNVERGTGLKLRTQVAISRYDCERGAFNHGDVDWESGDLFIAHPSMNTIEIVAARDGTAASFYHKGSLRKSPGAGGLLCSQRAEDPHPGKLIFVAARDAGKVQVFDAAGSLVSEIQTGPAPGGLAYDQRGGRLLVADINDHSARLLAPRDGRTLWATQLPGRPLWCGFDRAGDRFLVNIREPAGVAVLDAANGTLVSMWQISAKGPHGVDIDQERRRAFVACDSGTVVCIDLARDGEEIGRVPIAGAADATWYNRRLDRLYVTIPDPGVVDVIDCRTMKVVDRIAAEPGTTGSAFDPVRQRLFVFLPKTGRVAVYDEP